MQNAKISVATDDALADEEKAAFKNVIRACACGNLRRATRVVTRQFDEVFRALGLRSTQVVILMHVGEQGTAILSALARKLAMDASTLTRNLNPLEEAGLIVAEKTPAGRRRSVKLTDAGIAMLRRALPLWQKAQASVTASFDGAEWERLRGTLDRLAG
ncbi:MAG: MarR family winged helix-turn-helix transcriptional regulator [Pseudomonadota bacterium]